MSLSKSQPSASAASASASAASALSSASSSASASSSLKRHNTSSNDSTRPFKSQKPHAGSTATDQQIAQLLAEKEMLLADLKHEKSKSQQKEKEINDVMHSICGYAMFCDCLLYVHSLIVFMHTQDRVSRLASLVCVTCQTVTANLLRVGACDHLHCVKCSVLMSQSYWTVVQSPNLRTPEDIKLTPQIKNFQLKGKKEINLFIECSICRAASRTVFKISEFLMGGSFTVPSDETVQFHFSPISPTLPLTSCCFSLRNGN